MAAPLHPSEPTPAAATRCNIPALQQLRRARDLLRARLAETLGIAQSEISKIEHRSDLYVSTLRSYLQAMGAELDLIARFPDGRAVRVTQF